MTPASSGTGALPRAVVFDLDGTLVDSLPDIADALGELMEAHGLARHPVEAVRTMIGKGVGNLVERAFAAHGRGLGIADHKAAVERYLGLYEPRATRDTVLFPHVEATVRTLHAAGVRMAVCTNKPTAVSREIVEAFGLAAMIPVVVGGDFGPAKKPDPALVAATVDLLGVTAAEAVMVGDSGNDVVAAKAAGLSVIVVEYGYTDIPPADLGGDRLIADFGALHDALVSLARDGACAG